MALREHRQRRLPCLAGVTALALVLAACVAEPPQSVAPSGNRLDRSLLEAAADSELQRDHNAALTYYRTLYRRDPGDVDVVVGLSRNLRRLSRANEANAIVLRALKGNEKHATLIGELGKIQLAMGQPLEAVETLSRAEALGGARWDLLGALAVAYDRIQMFEQSTRAYERALELSPENTTVLNNMALSLALKGELDRAIETLERASALPEAGGHMRQNLALLYAVRGDLEATERLVRRDLPQQIADENMANYRRIAAASAERRGAALAQSGALAEALGTAVQVQPQPAEPMPASPVGVVETAKAAPLEEPAPEAKPVMAAKADKPMAETAKTEPAARKPRSETDLAAARMAEARASGTGMAGLEPEVRPMAAKPGMTEPALDKAPEPVKAEMTQPVAAAPSEPAMTRIPEPDARQGPMTAKAGTTSRAAKTETVGPDSNASSMAAKAEPAEPAQTPVAHADPMPDKTPMATPADAVMAKPKKGATAPPAGDNSSAVAAPDRAAKPAADGEAADRPQPAMAEESAVSTADTPAASAATPAASAPARQMAARSLLPRDGAVEADAEPQSEPAARPMETTGQSASAVAEPKTGEAEKSMTPEPAMTAADSAVTPAVMESPSDGTGEAAATKLAMATDVPGYRLQLGSFRSVDGANRLIRILADDHGDLLNGTQLAVHEASLDDDRQVYRVISDVLADRSAASSLCDALKGRELGCLMLRSR